MRLFPEMSILSPGDRNEVIFCMDFIFNSSRPKYLRLRKAGEENFNFNTKLQKPGFWNNLTNKNKKKIFLTTGNGLKIAQDLLRTKKFNDYDIYTCPIWGAYYRNHQEEQIKKFSDIIIVEDHLLSGGFGSWIMESIQDKSQLKK